MQLRSSDRPRLHQLVLTSFGSMGKILTVFFFLFFISLHFNLMEHFLECSEVYHKVVWYNMVSIALHSAEGLSSLHCIL